MTLKIVDWAMMESDYIHGYYVTNNRNVQKHVHPTAEMLAKKYNVALSAVNRRCSQDKWVIRREQYKEKLREKTFDKCEQQKVDILLSESSKYDTQNLQKLDQVDKILNRFLGKYSQIEDYDDTDAPTKIDLREVETFMNILLKRHQLSRAIFGEPSTTKPKDKAPATKPKTSVIPSKSTQNLEVLVETINKNESLKDKLMKEKAKLLEMANG